MKIMRRNKFSLHRSPILAVLFLFISSNATHNQSDTIVMQWCGKNDELPPQPMEIPDYISEENMNFSVKLQPGLVACRRSVNSTEIIVNTDEPFQNKSHFYDSGFSANGYFRVGNYYYPPEGFCISKLSGVGISVKVCGHFDSEKANVSQEWSFPECGINNTCIPKCCALNHVFTLTEGQPKIGRCQNPIGHSDQVKNNPDLYTTPYQKTITHIPTHYFINPVQRNTTNPQFLVHESGQINLAYKNAISLCFHIRQDGVLLYHDLKSNWVEVSQKDYCVNPFQLNGSLAHVFDQNSLDNEKTFGVFLRMRAESHENAVRKSKYAILYGSAFFVASVFLLVTFVVYILLWKEQKLQGWITMSHTITMFYLYLFRGLNYFLELRARDIGRAYRSRLCTCSGILTHYFFLSNFCWLTVVCFSLFWTFRGINVGGRHSKDIGQYLLYAAFGWCLPLLFVAVSVVLDQNYSYEPCNMVTVPEYGLGTCSVSIGALGPYKYYPVAILLLLNLIFFSMTFYKLNEYKKSASRTSKILKGNKQLFRVITKLFFVMGFTWSFELFLWCWWWLSGAERKWFRAMTNLINCLLAIAIFIIYVCKTNVVNSLKKSYPRLTRFLSIITNRSESSGTVPSTSLEYERRNAKTLRNHQMYYN